MIRTLFLALLLACCGHLLSQDAAPHFIYFTFDDGPLDGSDKIDDAVRFEEVPITVFLVGKHAEFDKKDLDLYRANPYITLANHSYSHARNHFSKFYMDPEGVVQDIEYNQQLLAIPTKMVRLPGRNMWRLDGRSRNDVSSGAAAADLLAEKGYNLYGWDMEWMHDPKTAEPVGTAEEVFQHIEHVLEKGHTFTPGHLVLLCHDEMFREDYEETELKKLIELVKNHDGFQIGKLEDYP